MKAKTSLFLHFFLIVGFTSFSFGQLTIATWNIEHLGSSGRGFPEIKKGKLGDRTADDYKMIASFIKDSLSLEVICVQEIASSKKESEKSYSDELGKIISNLGTTWKYYLANFEGGGSSENEMQNAFIYNSDKVELKIVFEMDVPNYEIDEKKMFDRKPLIGYFVPKGENDGFIIVNLHMASGQDNFENHLASMIIVEQNLGLQLKKKGIEKEKDIIILGDFNNNPFALNDKGGCCEHSDLMYKYMEEKGYIDLVDASFGTTRMNKTLSSIIDHVLISKAAKKHISQSKAQIYKPKDLSETGMLKWRSVYSDHFPIYFDYK
ncbi:MAG: endonuclease/exonuclease/phosphatase family protein [Bacteroidota bacterium]